MIEIALDISACQVAICPSMATAIKEEMQGFLNTGKHKKVVKEQRKRVERKAFQDELFESREEEVLSNNNDDPEMRSKKR